MLSSYTYYEPIDFVLYSDYVFLLLFNSYHFVCYDSFQETTIYILQSNKGAGMLWMYENQLKGGGNYGNRKSNSIF